MRGSTFELESKAIRGPQARHWLLAALCVGGALLSAVSHADDRRRGGDDGKHRGQYSQQQRGHDSRHDRRHDDRRDLRRDHDRRSHDWDSRSDRRSFDRHQFNRPHNRQWDRRDSGRYFRPDWHYYSGRYWAPARYRGRYCADRRHYHGGAHYHVARRDYYDYYYPRYSPLHEYGGPRPYGANASVIITLPLF